MFREVLRDIKDRVEGAVAVSLISLDGIAVDSVNEDGLPLDVWGAEFGGFVKSIGNSESEVNAGKIEQFSLVTDRYITFLSSVTDEYFLLLVLDPNGNYGRARFELAKAKHLLRGELS